MRYKFFHKCRFNDIELTQNWDLPDVGPIIKCQYCQERVIAESLEDREAGVLSEEIE